MTKEDAIEIVEVHEITQILADDEKRASLEKNNPSLLKAYEALWLLADS